MLRLRFARLLSILALAYIVALGMACGVTSALSDLAGGSAPSQPAAGGASPGTAAAPKQLTFHRRELAEMFDAAKAKPQSFDAVYAYANAVAADSHASLIDHRFTDSLKFRPAAELDPDLRDLVDDALTRLGVVITGGGLSDAQMDQAIAAKARLLGLGNRGGEERALVDSYVAKHPGARPVVKRRLEILRDAKDGAEFEAQCSHSRESLKSAPDAQRLELLTMCVSLHPDNKEDKSDVEDYATYLPDMSKDEQRLYHGHVAKACLRRADAHEVHCANLCGCKERPWDKKYTEHCQEVCLGCLDQANEKRKRCGTPP